MLPGDRLICLFVSPLATGYQFGRWPLHVTVVPWFRTNKATDEIADIMASVVAWGPLRLIAGEETGFGYRGRKRVTLLQGSSELESIEQKVRTLLHNYKALIVDETTKKRGPFRPHVTHQQGKSLSKGDIFVCNSLYIVEQKGDYKQITATINL